MKTRHLLRCFSITTAQKRDGLQQAPFLLVFVISLFVLDSSVRAAFAAEILNTTVIRQSSVYSAPELFDVYKDSVGRPVTTKTAASIAERLRQKYQDDGYSRPGYRIVDDGLQSGIIRIDVVEASISAVQLHGNSGPYRERLETLFSGLPSDRSLRPVDIRELVQQARRLPGLDVNISTRPDEQGNGSFVLEVDSDYQAVGGSLTLTNRGTKQIGRNLAFARLISNGPFGSDSSAGLFAATAEDSSTYSSAGVFLKLALGSNGTSIFSQGSVASLQIESSGTVVDQDRKRLLVKLTQPLPDWSNRKLSLWGGLELDDLDVRYDGLAARDDRLRSIESGITLSWRQDKRQHLLSVEAEFGLRGLGASLHNRVSDDDARRADYAIARLHYVHLLELNATMSVRVDSYAQHSPHVLPSIKRFKVGGGRIGRGFDAAALNGDRGLGSKVELRRRLASNVWMLQRIDGYTFYDIGAAWANDAVDRESAASTGLGLSVRGDNISGYLEIAKPLTHADADGLKEAGVFVELTGRF